MTEITINWFACWVSLAIGIVIGMAIALMFARGGR